MNDFHFAFRLLNVILFPLKLCCKSFKMRPKIASESVFFDVQSAYSLLIVSKLNFAANFVSHEHPNGSPKAVQNCPANGLRELRIDLGASGLAQQRFWTQVVPFWIDFGRILGASWEDFGRLKQGTVAEHARTRTGYIYEAETIYTVYSLRALQKRRTFCRLLQRGKPPGPRVMSISDAKSQFLLNHNLFSHQAAVRHKIACLKS